MIYAKLKLQFAKDLKARIAHQQKVIDIGIWAHSVYIDWPDCKDKNFLCLLISLSRMELGYQFARTYEQLNKIADDLIAGKEVVL